MKKKTFYLFASTVGLLGLLTGCSNNSQSSNNTSNEGKSHHMMKSKNNSSSLSLKSAKSTSGEKKSTQNNTKLNNDDDRSQNDSNEKVTVANIDPKILASTILLLGGEKSEAWKSFATQDSLEVNVIKASSDNNNYSDPGTGVSYMFTSEGKNYGELFEYRLSSDGTTVYCYEQPFRDSASRHVTPFATLSAKAIQHAQNSTEVKALASKMEVKS